MIARLVSGRIWPVLAALLLCALFVLANLLVQPRLAGARADFTARKLYTLTPATRQVLGELQEPV